MFTEFQTDTICLNSEQYAVYRCICYFDIFSHPLKLNEIFEFTGLSLLPDDLKSILEELIALEMISCHAGFYFLSQAQPRLVKKRTDSELRFLKKQKTIKWFGRLIARFPFVESVSISGSCSKGLLDKNSDVDYFIITSPKKVWLCRTILIIFKKIFLLNSKKYFCVNYFIDSDHLVIPDENIFVASEISTLMPVSNRVLFEKFLIVNSWTKEYLPNKQPYQSVFLEAKNQKKYLSGLLEFLLDNKLGDAFDRLFFRMTLRAWQRKFPDFSKEDFDLNLRSKKIVSKHHPRGFQQKVLLALNSRIEKIKVMA